MDKSESISRHFLRKLFKRAHRRGKAAWCSCASYSRCQEINIDRSDGRGSYWSVCTGASPDIDADELRADLATIASAHYISADEIWRHELSYIATDIWSPHKRPDEHSNEHSNNKAVACALCHSDGPDLSTIAKTSTSDNLLGQLVSSI